MPVGLNVKAIFCYSFRFERDKVLRDTLLSENIHRRGGVMTCYCYCYHTEDDHLKNINIRKCVMLLISQQCAMIM